MMKNRKGFTLIELIVTIVILSLVFVASSFELTHILEDSRKKESLSVIEGIMDSANTYLSMKKKDASEVTSVELKNIVKSGLVADTIYKVKNGLSKSCSNFSENEIIYYEIVDNQTRVYMKYEENKCYLDDIDKCMEYIGDCK